MSTRSRVSRFGAMGLFCHLVSVAFAAEPVAPLDSSDLLFTIFAEDPIGESSPIVPPTPQDLALDEIDAENAAEERSIDPSRSYGQEAPPIRPPITFLRNEAVLLRKGQHMLDLGLVYNINEYEFPVVVPPNNLTKAVIKDRTLYVPFAYRYGVTDNLQAQIFMPIGFANE